MSGRWPSVSVIMPVKNGQKFIGDALNSIAGQSVDVAEIHVIDDGSSDGTLDIVKAFARTHPGVSLHRGQEKGPGPARNIGLREAKGEVIAFLDCDDLWPAGKLERQLRRLTVAPEVKMCSGFVRYFDKQSTSDLTPSDDSRTWEIFHVHLGASIYKREVFDKIGLFDERFTYGEDVDLMLRFREAELPFSILREITLYYRKHEDSMTSMLTAREKSDFNHALFLSLKRRKGAGKTEQLTPFADFVGY